MVLFWFQLTLGADSYIILFKGLFIYLFFPIVLLHPF